ncbi:MAG TPA: hypothetical protein VIY48_04585 [Candidatus Paceibacterota bacterium]
MKAHFCIGGPLDGEFATSDDFYGGYEKVPGTRRNDYSKRVEGMYEHLKDEYHQFNNASRVGAPKGCHVVWIHKNALSPSISPRKR